jgi:hypothetical protein
VEQGGLGACLSNESTLLIPVIYGPSLKLCLKYQDDSSRVLGLYLLTLLGDSH